MGMHLHLLPGAKALQKRLESMVKVTIAFTPPEQAAFSGRAASTVKGSSWTIISCRHKADRQTQTARVQEQKADGMLRVGPADSPPSYEGIDSQPANRAIMSLFRRKMVAAIGHDSEAQGYITQHTCLTS